MAGSIGSVYYDVLPNLDGFAAKVAAGLGAVKPVKVKVDVDNSSAAKTTAVAQRAAAQQTAIAQRAAAQQTAIRTRAAAQQTLLAQRTAAQVAAAQARAAQATERATARETAVAQRAAAAQAAAAKKAADAKASAEGRKTTVAGNLAEIDRAAASTAKLSAADARLASAQGNARVAALRLAEAQADHAAGSTALIASQESYARSLRSVSAAEAAAAAAAAKGQKAGSFSGKVGTTEVQAVGTNFLRAGAAIGVGVGLAVRASANFESAMSGVASTGNYTSGQLELLSKAAIAGGQATKYSATEAADGEAELVKAGLSVQQVLGGGLTGALNLAAAGNLSVADSAGAAATAINQFGLQGSDATHVADRFVQIAGIAQGETSDVAEAFKNGAVTAKQYGLSIDDASTVLAAYAKNGIVGAQAGTLLKSSLTQLYAPTGRVKDELNKLGISAYDAAGNARPVADVAESLHAALGPLNEDAKNNALARIFGKETLQGGAILAAEGAAGLGKIRAELDKFPTAAQTAATKMDNLKGDVEQLSGSLETGLIKSGSGSNAFLRDLAQGATDAVNGFTNLPSAVQKGALGVGAISSVALLAGGGLIKLVGSAAQAKVALDTLGAAGSAFPGKMAGVAKGVGVAVAAFALLQGIGRGSDALFGGVETSLGDAGQAIAGLGDQAGAATPSLDKFFTFTSNQDLDLLNNQVSGLGDAFRHVNEGGGKVAGVLNGISGALGFTTQASQIDDRFGQLDATLTSMGATSAPQAARGFSAIATAADKAGTPLDVLVSKFPEYKAQLQDQATALGVTVPDSAKVYADWMGGKVPDAVLAAAKANPQVAASFGIVQQATEAASTGFDTAVGALKNLANPQKISGDAAQALSTKLFGTAQAAVSASNAQIAYAQAVKQAAASTGGGVDPKTDKGASNLSLLNQQATAYQGVAAAQIAAGKSAGSVAAGAADARKAFIENAEAMGVSSGKAKDLADKYGLIPKNIKVKIEEEVQARAEDELTKLKALDGTIITPKIQTLIDQGKYGEALGKVKDLQKTRRAKIDAEAHPEKAAAKLDKAAKARTAALKAQAEKVGSESGKLDKAARARKVALKAKAEGVGGASGSLDKAARSRKAAIKAVAQGVGAVQAAIDAVHGKKVEIMVTRKTNEVTGATGGTYTAAGFVGRGPKGYSIGGSVWGAGTSTSDSINARLANGEEVIRTKQADRNRAILKRINAGGVWDISPRLARGGSVPKAGSSRQASGGGSGSMRTQVVVNVDLGSALGGVRRIVADEVSASGEYAATLTRMGGR